MAKPAGKKRIMRKFTIDELSSVDVPAQEGAQALILKRAEVGKSGVVQMVTGEAEGHRHGIKVRKWGDGEIDIWVLGAQMSAEESSHDHPLLVGTDGIYSVVENAGHTHTLDSAALAAAIVGTVNKEAEMTPEEKARLEKLEKDLKRSNAIIALSAEHRSYFDGIEKAESKDAFLAKSADERDGLIAEAKKRAEEAEAKKNAEDPVLHTTKAGLDIRKSDGPTVLALAKQADERDTENADLRKQVKALTDETSTATYLKRAREELPDVPGSEEARAAMLKAIDGIEDEKHRETALAALKSKGDGISKLFKSLGTADPGASDDAEGEASSDKLEKLAKAYQKDHPELSYEQAEARVLDTPEGAALYDDITERGTHVISDVAA